MQATREPRSNEFGRLPFLRDLVPFFRADLYQKVGKKADQNFKNIEVKRLHSTTWPSRTLFDLRKYVEVDFKIEVNIIFCFAGTLELLYQSSTQGDKVSNFFGNVSL